MYICICIYIYTYILPRINSDLKLIKSIKLELRSVNLPEGDGTCTNLYLYCTWSVAGAYLVFWVT